MPTGRKIIWTTEQLDWIKDNQFGISRKALLEKLKTSFNDLDPRVNLPAINNLCKRHQWQNGFDGKFKAKQKPWNDGVTGYMGANSTSFKKNRTPHNKKPIGSERIHNRDGYVMVKIAEPNHWTQRHRVVWEKHKGEIPKGYMIRHIDGDPTNDDIDNLICIPRGANVTINKDNKANTGNYDLNKAIILTETLRHKARQYA